MSDSLETQLRSLNLGSLRERVRASDTTLRPSSGAGVATSGRFHRPKANGGDDSTTLALRPVRGNSNTNGGRVRKPKKTPKSRQNKKSKKAARKAAAKLSTGVNPHALHAALDRVVQEGAAPMFEMRRNAATRDNSRPSLGSSLGVIVEDFADLDPAFTPVPSSPLSRSQRKALRRSGAWIPNRPNDDEGHDGDVEMGDV
ncbi:hypothetical protein SLS62_010214 [Diatrype stigma]|uniref:Ribosome biogenesis protein SLX9 n=1 Tax=Diatrype stigma TaxID=117547 RepID=A0AAN9UA80_9PEZI